MVTANYQTTQNQVRQHALDLIHRSTGHHHVLGVSPVLIDLMEGDIVGATVLNQILYWTDRTNDPDGYFWKTYAQWKSELGFGKYRMMRVFYGDSRTKTRKKNLQDVGVEITHKKAPNGLRVNFYRLNQPHFFAHLVEFLENNYGLTFSDDSKPDNLPEPERPSDVEIVENEPSTMQTSAMQTWGHQNTSKKASREHNANLPKSATTTFPSLQCSTASLTDNTSTETHHTDTKNLADFVSEERDFEIFDNYQVHFGKLSRKNRKKLKNEARRLGEALTKTVINRCVDLGRTWQYVVKALENEPSPPEVSENSESSEIKQSNSGRRKDYLREIVEDILSGKEQPQTPKFIQPIIKDSVHGPAPRHKNGETISDIWRIAHYQFEKDPLYKGFHSFMYSLKLVDFEPTTCTFSMVVNGNCGLVNLFERQLQRSMQFQIADFYKMTFDDIQLKFYTAEDWNKLNS